MSALKASGTTVFIWSCMIVLSFLGVVSQSSTWIRGYAIGIERGHREMKAWQDSYYATPAPAGIGKPQAPAEHQNSFKIPNTIIYPIRCINQLTGEDLPWRKNAKGELVCAAAHPLKLGKRKASEPPSESGYCVEGLAGVPTPQVPQ